MTYEDILKHEREKLVSLERYKDSKGSSLAKKYEEHKMIAELIEERLMEEKK